jgi:hypothetical protein
MDAAAAITDAITTNLPPSALPDPEHDAAVERLLPRHDVTDHFETECGFVVSGGRLERAACTPGNPGATVEVLEQGGDVPGVLRLWDVSPAVSLVAELDDGRSFVLPALRGYIGHVNIDDTGVSNVSYVPSSNTERFMWYEPKRAEIDRLRALVAVSVQGGRFQVNDPDTAAGLGDRIRVEKAIDPALGVYAAHAYSAAGLDRKIYDVLWFMKDDLEIAVFDVVLLASRLIDDRSDWPVVPFCPVLTQAWSLLRPREFELQPAVGELAQHLENSLWTTFSESASGRLIDAVESGQLT